MSDLQRRISRGAKQLGHNWIGAEHVVLALLDSGDGSRAGRALRECGITRDGYAEAIAQLREDYTARPGLGEGVLEHSRELIAVGARAEGLAMAMGSGAADREHTLMAMLWHRGQPPVAIQLMQTHFGVTRRQIVDRLIALGVEIPKAQLPPDLAWQERRLVSRAEFKELQTEFKRQGIHYGCQPQGDQILVFTALLTPA